MTMLEGYFVLIAVIAVVCVTMLLIVLHDTSARRRRVDESVRNLINTPIPNTFQAVNSISQQYPSLGQKNPWPGPLRLQSSSSAHTLNVAEQQTLRTLLDEKIKKLEDLIAKEKDSDKRKDLTLSLLSLKLLYQNNETV